MTLTDVMNKFKASDLEEENEEVKKISGLNYVEAWELEKTKDQPRDFFTFHKEMSSQSIGVEK